MKVALTLLFLISHAFAQSSADYKVLPGKFHKSGSVKVSILPVPEKFKVQMDYAVKKKDWVPVPAKLLKGKSVMEFPEDFRTETGYQNLEKQKSMTIPKAVLKFVKRADFGNLKNAYFLQVLPTNKKTKIDIVYHPSLPSVGWEKVKITFISKIPLLNGYVLVAKLKREVQQGNSMF